MRTLREAFVLQSPVDRLDHLRLNVLRVHQAVRSHAPRQANREPAAAGAEIRDHGAVGDAERVHDQIGLVPLVAIGRFEQAEILR